MNTIQITTANGVINYTEAEILRTFKRLEELDGLNQKGIDNRHKIRDFFSEGQWNNNEFSASKEDINELLQSIGANKLTTKYKGTYTITGTFSVEVEDEDDVEDLFKDNVTVDFYDGDIDVDDIEVVDIETDE